MPAREMVRQVVLLENDVAAFLLPPPSSVKAEARQRSVLPPLVMRR